MRLCAGQRKAWPVSTCSTHTQHTLHTPLTQRCTPVPLPSLPPSDPRAAGLNVGSKATAINPFSPGLAAPAAAAAAGADGAKPASSPSGSSGSKHLHYTGGSSSGTAAVLAAGVCPIAIGERAAGRSHSPLSLCCIGFASVWARYYQQPPPPPALALERRCARHARAALGLSWALNVAPNPSRRSSCLPLFAPPHLHSLFSAYPAHPPARLNTPTPLRLTTQAATAAAPSASPRPSAGWRGSSPPTGGWAGCTACTWTAPWPPWGPWRGACR